MSAPLVEYGSGTCYAGFAFLLMSVWIRRTVLWSCALAGFACGVAPRAVFLLVVGRPKIFASWPVWTRRTVCYGRCWFCFWRCTSRCVFSPLFMHKMLGIMVVWTGRTVPESLRFHMCSTWSCGGWMDCAFAPAQKISFCTEGSYPYATTAWTLSAMVLGWTTPSRPHRRFLSAPRDVTLTPPQTKQLVEIPQAQFLGNVMQPVEIPQTQFLDKVFMPVVQPQV